MVFNPEGLISQTYRETYHMQYCHYADEVVAWMMCHNTSFFYTVVSVAVLHVYHCS